jgi:pimeloyl-ACP methyl ester carboxylesterase
MMTLRTAGTELRALANAALALPLRVVLPAVHVDPAAPHPTPVVFVHGLLGDRTNFLALGRHLAGRGVRSVAHFDYSPRLDYQRLAARLGREIDALCEVAGVEAVDVVGHSLGGLVGRYLVDTQTVARVRHLVTLGAPYYAGCMPASELAVFAADDPLIPVPRASDGLRGRVVVVPECGHLGLLYHPTALRTVADFLTAPRARRLLRAA